MSFVSPLRYPGGKGRLAPFIREVIKKNGLIGGHYVEPYCGGAGVALAVLFSEFVRHIHINDISKSVYAFWWSALHQTDDLCDRIRNTHVTLREWFRQKEVQDDPDADLLDLGFSTFFLNRTNRSGIIRGGVIGGKEQTGKWSLSARFNKEDLIDRVKRIGRYRDRISLYNIDAADLLIRHAGELPEKTLIYLDPPYWVKGEGLYEHHYGPLDHLQISKLAKNMRHSWIVSYDNVKEIRRLYRGIKKRPFDIFYSAQDRMRGRETMFFSSNLIIPGKIIPSREKVA